MCRGVCVCRMVCQALINSEMLEWERTQLWALTFKLFRKIIGGVDYKVWRKLHLHRGTSDSGHRWPLMDI